MHILKKDVYIKYLNEEARIPYYSTEWAAGADLVSTSEITIDPGEVEMVGTGLSIELPPDCEGQIRPRSGLALKHKVTVLNAPGTIDPDYRGEIKVILINLGKDAYHVHPGDRIAQLIISRFERSNFISKEELSHTVRDDKGFGSTGL